VAGCAEGLIFRRVLKGRGGLGERLDAGSVVQLVKKHAAAAG
jgi:hypothetical protein